MIWSKRRELACLGVFSATATLAKANSELTDVRLSIDKIDYDRASSVGTKESNGAVTFLPNDFQDLKLFGLHEHALPHFSMTLMLRF